jgi:hypothetical protein
MRHLITGLIAAVAVMAAAPAMACGWTACGQPQVYVQPPVYVSPVATYGYSPCNPCVGWTRERLPDPEQQYYYVNQGPTFTGPGNWAPPRVYREGFVSGYGYGRPYYRPHRHYHRHWHRRPQAVYFHGRRVVRSYN